MKKDNKALIFGTAFAAAALGISGCTPRPVPAVYGPPEYFTSSPALTTEAPETEGPSETTDAPDTKPETDTSASEIPEVVYGPPSWFENESGFDPSENVPEDVYGPPSYWNPELTEEATN